MKYCRHIGPVCALWLAACGGQSEALLIAAPPSEEAVVFAVDLWPGEGIPVIQMQRALLPLRAQPDPAAPVVDTLRGRAGQRIAFDSTRYQTITAGLIEVIEPFLLSGRDLGDVKSLTRDRYYLANVPENSMRFNAPDTIEFLQYRAEGTCFVRVAQRVVDAQPCPGFGRESVKVVREPVTRWWVRTRGSIGVPGWLMVSDTTARSVRREF